MAVCERTAILILGAESSGNRLILRAIRGSGFTDLTECRYITDAVIPNDGSPVVWLRSQPHAREWPDVRLMKELLKQKGYRVVALVPMRDWWSTMRSQVEHGHVANNAEALEHLRFATGIFGQLMSAGVPFVPISYEACVANLKVTIGHSLSLLAIEIEIIEQEEVDNRNAKWI